MSEGEEDGDNYDDGREKLVQPIQPRIVDNRPQHYKEQDSRPRAYNDGVDEAEVILKQAYASNDQTLDSHVFGNIGLKMIDFRSPVIQPLMKV